MMGVSTDGLTFVLIDAKLSENCLKKSLDHMLSCCVRLRQLCTFNGACTHIESMWLVTLGLR